MKFRPLSAASLAFFFSTAAFSFLLTPPALGAASQATPQVAAPAVPTTGQADFAAVALTLGRDFLAGYDAGLYRVDESGSRAMPLWLEGEIRKIVTVPSGWFFLTSKGILFSANLVSFESRSNGLPVKTYKLYEKGAKSFLLEAQDLKDLEADPGNPDRLVACTKDSVYLSKDGGHSWENLGAPSTTPGIKAVAFAPYPVSGEAAVWASHPIKGLFVRKFAQGSVWTEANEGLACLSGTTMVEEVADLVLVPQANPAQARASGASASFPSPQLWASNSFLPRIYRRDAPSNQFREVYSQPGDFGTAESLAPLPDGSLRFVTQGAVRRLDPVSGASSEDGPSMIKVEAALRAKPDWQLLSVAWNEGGRPAALSELWLVSFRDRKPYRAKAEGREGLYLQTGFMVNQQSRERYFRLMKERGLDSLVVDLKDDSGRFRFEPRDPLLRKIGRSSNPLDVETFVAEAKARGVYLIARIPVFKDEVVFKYGSGKYAIRDRATGQPWRGYNTVKVNIPAPAAVVPSGAANPYGPSTAAKPAAPQPPKPVYLREEIKEYWVDPYCEEVWAYNVAIANEIIARGFDEIQFDYIRFPTDGDNLDSATFAWKDQGMDKESALASFLRFARENIVAPISIDIYGANGWYRSGVRTGQDVELLAKYSDAICPMFYPSHFEQDFLAEAPAAERPYRIYRIGSLRNEAIARKRVVVRPYVQAFYMNVSYDRSYYDLDYVVRETIGVRDSTNLGMTFWNNAGRYDDVPFLEFDADGKLADARSPAAPAKPAAPATGSVPAAKPVASAPAGSVAASIAADETVAAAAKGILD